MGLLVTQAPTISLDELKALRPCDKRLAPTLFALTGKPAVTIQDAIACGADLGQVLWTINGQSSRDPEVARRLRLWMADCAAHVLPILELRETSDAPRRAIDTARRYARGVASAEELQSSWVEMGQIAAALPPGQMYACARLLMWCVRSQFDRGATKILCLDMELAFEMRNVKLLRKWMLGRLVVRFSDGPVVDVPLSERATHGLA